MRTWQRNKWYGTANRDNPETETQRFPLGDEWDFYWRTRIFPWLTHTDLAWQHKQRCRSLSIYLADSVEKERQVGYAVQFCTEAFDARVQWLSRCVGYESLVIIEQILLSFLKLRACRIYLLFRVLPSLLRVACRCWTFCLSQCSTFAYGKANVHDASVIREWWR